MLSLKIVGIVTNIVLVSSSTNIGTGGTPITTPSVEDPYPNSFIQGWNEPIKMDGIIYFNQILGQQ